MTNRGIWEEGSALVFLYLTLANHAMNVLLDHARADGIDYESGLPLGAFVSFHHVYMSEKWAMLAQTPVR